MLASSGAATPLACRGAAFSKSSPLLGGSVWSLAARPRSASSSVNVSGRQNSRNSFLPRSEVMALLASRFSARCANPPSILRFA